MDYDTLRRFAEGLAREAGAVLLSHYGRVSAREKGPADLVTDADLASQRLVSARLASAYPDHAVLAEEDGQVGEPGKDWRWVVDPLDGTMNFAHGFPLWCVSIGLEHLGVPVVGVIFDPLHGTLYSASRGGGATRDGVPLSVSRVDSMAGALIAAALPTDFAADSARQLSLIAIFSAGTHSIRRTGSTALNLAVLASGGCEIVYATSVHPWDVAAGLVLVAEAGGLVTDIAGGDYKFDQPTILASNGRIHDAAIAAAQSISSI